MKQFGATKRTVVHRLRALDFLTANAQLNLMDQSTGHFDDQSACRSIEPFLMNFHNLRTSRLKTFLYPAPGLAMRVSGMYADEDPLDQ